MVDAKQYEKITGKDKHQNDKMHKQPLGGGGGVKLATEMKAFHPKHACNQNTMGTVRREEPKYSSMGHSLSNTEAVAGYEKGDWRGQDVGSEC